MTQIDGEALQVRVVRTLGSRDRQAVAALVTHDVHYEDAFAPAALIGPDQVADHLALVWSAFPDVSFETTGPALHDGDRIVALPMRVVGNHTEPLGGVPATDRFLHVHGMLVLELDATAHRVHRARLFADRYAAAVQLGVLPQAGTVSDRAVRAIQGFGLLWGR
ncbi:ester cyclase [Patulibacter sp.]|uniref:ester cyclase n=1 Tax=Patulibacter sp. TaxID=1912859 RepID=UPI002722721F|nr:ester cyclase [Patulibacter sp.]MDO9407592.1 ester cyclase [Patulibacter sp.]